MRVPRLSLCAGLLAGAWLLLAPRPSVASTVIVKYRHAGSSGRRLSAFRRAGVTATVGSVRGQHARVVAVSGDPVVAARRLAAAPGVAYAEPNVALHAFAAPNDALLGQMGDLALIHALPAWSAIGLGAFPATGGVPVGIVDTGIDPSHEDLAGKVAACASSVEGTITVGSCADDNDHGTHVAGTIGALANNAVGIAGVAFASKLVVCKALDGAGSGTTADVASCIRWVHDRGAKVISLSLGGPGSTTLAAAVHEAWANGGRSGSVLVAAAGNDGSAAIEYPSGYPEVVSVAAVDDAGGHAGFSNANAKVEIAAPGVQVLSTKRGGGYVRFSGTSMATPHVAGAAALLWGLHRRSSAATIRDDLDATVVDAEPAGRDPYFGFGALDLARLK
ncbi:MAG: alkaline serine protease [Solirubrobacterales bacterium]|jgi:thermitase|nr:alkaline serine protease [Solirubrobacterales bacterium]